MAAKKAQRICNPREAPLAFSLQIMLSTSEAEPGEQLSKNKKICACIYYSEMSKKREWIFTKWLIRAPDNIVFVDPKEMHKVRQQRDAPLL